mgnify:CR=1 FL=1
MIINPVTITPEQPVREVLKLMERFRISGVPVTRGEQLVGIVTNRDLRFETNLETPIAGDSGRLDSAGLINLIAVTEQKAAAELGRPLLLTDERTLSQVNQVFRTLGTLADYIHLRLSEKNDG